MEEIDWDIVQQYRSLLQAMVSAQEELGTVRKALLKGRVVKAWQLTIRLTEDIRALALDIRMSQLDETYGLVDG